MCVDFGNSLDIDLLLETGREMHIPRNDEYVEYYLDGLNLRLVEGSDCCFNSPRVRSALVTEFVRISFQDDHAFLSQPMHPDAHIVVCAHSAAQAHLSTKVTYNVTHQTSSPHYTR